ncbi:hypothetical protein ACWF5H_14730 [Arthrobacter sp. NPDC055138]
MLIKDAARPALLTPQQVLEAVQIDELEESRSVNRTVGPRKPLDQLGPSSIVLAIDKHS